MHLYLEQWKQDKFGNGQPKTSKKSVNSSTWFTIEKPGIFYKRSSDKIWLVMSYALQFMEFDRASKSILRSEINMSLSSSFSFISSGSEMKKIRKKQENKPH